MRRILVLFLMTLASPAFAQLDTSYSGLWFNTAQSGHGLEVSFLSPTSATVTWFVYDGQGNPVHLVGVGTVTNNRLTVPVLLNRGMRFGTFIPAEIEASNWGTLTLTFTTCNQATLEWNSTLTLGGFAFGTGSMPLSRLTTVGGLPCGRRSASGEYSGFIKPTASSSRVEVFGIFDDSGRVVLLNNALSSMYVGTYTTTGGNLTLQTSAIAALGYTFTGGTTVQTFNGTGPYVDGDNINGTYTSTVDTGGTYSLQGSVVYRRGASLARLAGRYIGTARASQTLTLDITAAGAISGTDTGGCTYTGTATIPDATYNVYNVQLTIANCTTANGTYAGPGALQDSVTYGDAKQLALGVSNETRSLVTFAVRQ